MSRRSPSPLAEAYRIAARGTLPARLAAVRVADNKEVLATLAPLARDDAPAELIHAVLDNERCTPAIAARYATSRHPEVRLRVAGWADMHAAPLRLLAADSEARVRAVAQTRLRQM